MRLFPDRRRRDRPPTPARLLDPFPGDWFERAFGPGDGVRPRAGVRLLLVLYVVGYWVEGRRLVAVIAATFACSILAISGSISLGKMAILSLLPASTSVRASGRLT